MTRRRAATATLAAGLVSGLLLTGCSDTEADYCQVLEEESSVLSDLAARSGTPGTDVLTPSLAAIERLRDSAPAELRDEWDTVLNAWSALSEAVADSGIEPEDYRPGEQPEGLTRKEQRRLAEVASKLASPRVVEAAAAVEDHALEVCDVDLGG